LSLTKSLANAGSAPRRDIVLDRSGTILRATSAPSAHRFQNHALEIIRETELTQTLRLQDGAEVIRQRTPGAWELRYSLGRDPATDKRRVATATIRGTRREAEKELRRLLRTLDLNEHVDPSRMTVREWLTSWLAAIRPEVSPKTHERYCEIVENFLAVELGALLIAKLAPAHISIAYTGWATHGRRDGKPGGLSPQTRRHIHRILNAALSRAVDNRSLPAIPRT
jgi:hypothetical protein